MKTFLPIILLLLVITNANAQCEIDPNLTVPGFYPSINEGQFNATVDSNFTQVIQFKSIKDTIYAGFQIGIDSAIIIGVTGLPEGITWATNPKSVIKGGESACLLLSGVPAKGTEKGGEGFNGNYDLRLAYTLYFQFFGNTQTFTRDVTGYSIKVKAITVGLDEKNNNYFGVFPNPAKNNVTLTFNNDQESIKEISIIGLDGKVVYNGKYSGETVTLDISHLKSGMYFIQSKSDLNIKQVPLIIE